MFTHIYKSVQRTGIMLCALALVLSSCKDSAISDKSSQLQSINQTATSSSGKTIQIANDTTVKDVYWTGVKSRTGESIIGHSFVNDQGARQTDVLYRLSQLGSITPFAVAVDLKDEQLYFSDDDGALLARVSLNGGGSVDTLYSSADGVQAPLYMGINIINDTIVWADQAGILKGSLDGSAPIDTVYSNDQGVNTSVAVDLLLLGDIMYWTELGDSQIVAGRTKGDVAPQVLYEANDASPALSFVYDLEIDLGSGRLYVSDGAEENDSRILRGSLLGTDSLETIYSGSEDYASASSLAIDHFGRSLYWSQAFGAEFSGTVLRGPLDGGTPELVYDLRDFEGEGIGQVTSIAISDPLGLKGKTTQEEQQQVIYLHL